jgi:nucleoid-associated protein YgaU
MKEQYQNIPRQSADRTKQKILKQGEHLWILASDEYEDPGMWRAIAKANGIANPRRLEAGKKMIIPRLE